MTKKLLFVDGKLAFKDGKLVIVDDPSTCDCCGPPPPDPCKKCQNGTVPTSWTMTMTGAADSDSCSDCAATFNTTISPIGFVGGFPTTCQWTKAQTEGFSHCGFVEWDVILNAAADSPLGVDDIQISYSNSAGDGTQWHLPFPSGSDCSAPLTFTAANITHHDVSASCDFSGATITLTPVGPFFESCCDFSEPCMAASTTEIAALVPTATFTGVVSRGDFPCADCVNWNTTWMLPFVSQSVGGAAPGCFWQYYNGECDNKTNGLCGDCEINLQVYYDSAANKSYVVLSIYSSNCEWENEVDGRIAPGTTLTMNRCTGSFPPGQPDCVGPFLTMGQCDFTGVTAEVTL